MATIDSAAANTVQSPIVAVENVTAGYPDKLVWRDASFSLDRGQFAAVIGPNGAGKTTLFRLLLGLQQPINGTIRIFNEAPRRGNSRIGYVPQRHIVDSETNIECLELVHLAYCCQEWGFHLSAKSEREKALVTMEAVGAAELAPKSLNALSGGELQRIFLAEALVSDPDVLLLDEPLSNLDIRRAEELVQLVNKVVRSRNVTAMLVAHDINPLLPYLDQVVYVANGKVAAGAAKEVLTTERLTALYDTQVEVMRDPRGNVAIIGLER
jgi:zinc/manganese transport system ATP-binding protein